MTNSNTNPTRRDMMKTLAAGSLAASALGSKLYAQPVSPQQAITIDPTERFDLSPYLYMQFMEPLGTTDSSVEASWDHVHDCWREDLVKTTAGLAPTMLRWGGIFTDYYRWKEAVGPRELRKPMHNLLWGGMESNQIGTAEFVDFCQKVSAEPLFCVNFESDGRKNYMKVKDDIRTANAAEAAEWVAYCNDPDNALRKKHGIKQPLTSKFWQLGNETSYDRNGFNLDTTIAKTIEFAKTMRAVDPSIELIGWGDSGWAGKMLDRAGEHLNYIAFHHMFDPDRRNNPVLRGENYRKDPAATWDVLMQAWKHNDNKIRSVRDSLGGKSFPLAMTECHFAMPGRDRNDVMGSWAAGVSYARILNNHQRHGDLLKIATAADFCGTRWQVNAVMIPVPRFKGDSYLMPVARIMKLYRHHIGKQSVNVSSMPGDLDCVASRTGKTIYLHVANTNRTRAVKAPIAIPGQTITSARVFEIADDPTVELSYLNSKKVMQITEKTIPVKEQTEWAFPAASVSAVEIKLV